MTGQNCRTFSCMNAVFLELYAKSALGFQQKTIRMGAVLMVTACVEIVLWKFMILDCCKSPGS